MPRNVEIKARLGEPGTVTGLAAVRRRAEELAGAPAAVLQQDDTFFAAPHGRLKLRVFAPQGGDGAELIHYTRGDDTAARTSEYVRVPVPDPDALREALTRAIGQHGRVRKTRWLVLQGRTRIHLDAVEGLGDFMELEVVLAPEEDPESGRAEAEALMARLGLADAPRVAGAYRDLLAAASS
jgi:adenylate cyclase class IV